jgi:hypothetical protein
MSTKSLLPPLLALLLALLLAACSSLPVAPGRLGDAGAPLQRVTVETDADANTRMATAVDVVFVRDPALVTRLPESAVEWFDSRNLWLKSREPDLDVVSLQIPPGRRVREVPLPADACDVIAVLAYANHLVEAGQARLDVTDATDALVRVTASDVVLFDAGAVRRRSQR